MPGTSRINDKAVARVAEAAALSVPGCAAVDAKLAGLAGRGLPRVEVSLDRAASTASMSVEMAVSYPSPVVAVTEAVRAAIVAQVATLTGFRVTRVDVTVAAARHNAAAVTRVAVERHPADITPTPVTVRPLRVVSPRVRTSSRPLAHPRVPPQRPLAPIEVPPPPAVRPVTAPPAVTVRRIVRLHPPRVPVVAAPQPVRSVQAPEPVVVGVPRAPLPTPLTPITIRPAAQKRVSGDA